jgi:hypothetical protein
MPYPSIGEVIVRGWMPANTDSRKFAKSRATLALPPLLAESWLSVLVVLKLLHVVPAAIKEPALIARAGLRLRQRREIGFKVGELFLYRVCCSVLRAS